MNLIPINGRIIVKPAEAEKTTVGGIILPHEETSRFTRGTVVVVDKKDEFLMKGDEVIFDSYEAIELEHEGEKYCIMYPEAVMAVVGR